MKFLKWIILIISLILTDGGGAPTIEQSSNNLNITNEFNEVIARILEKFRPNGSRMIMPDEGDLITIFKERSCHGILYNVTTKLTHWPTAKIEIPSNNEENYTFTGQMPSVVLEAYLQTSNQYIVTEKFATTYVIKLTSQNEMSTEYPDLVQSKINLLVNNTQCKPNGENLIKREIKTHIGKIIHEYLTKYKFECTILKKIFLNMFPQFSQNSQERYYFIDTIPLNNCTTLNNITINGLWNAKSISFNGSQYENLPEIVMGSVKGSLVQKAPSTFEELSFRADNIYIWVDQNIAKVNVKAKSYSVLNSKLNTTLADDQSQFIIGGIESAIAASLKSVWNKVKLESLY